VLGSLFSFITLFLENSFYDKVKFWQECSCRQEPPFAESYFFPIWLKNCLHSMLLSLCSQTHSMRKSNCCRRQEPPLCGADCEMVLQTCVEWCPGEHQPGWCSLGGMMMVDAPRWEILILVYMELQTGSRAHELTHTALYIYRWILKKHKRIHTDKATRNCHYFDNCKTWRTRL
jgi:hypothetical protein